MSQAVCGPACSASWLLLADRLWPNPWRPMFRHPAFLTSPLGVPILSASTSQAGPPIYERV